MSKSRSATLVLGIETSCDDTSASVTRGNCILSNVVHTQLSLHQRFGGVVPELASRDHVIRIIDIIDRAIRESGVALADLEGIAVTKGPGLVGSLLVGLQAAKAMAMALDLPLVGVNHLEAHIKAAFLQTPSRPQPPRVDGPYIGLVVSGGHTSLYLINQGHHRLLGATRDDAAGEALDKVAKILGLGYPGGPAIERGAQGGNPKALSFPRALRRRDSLDFSYSGLKTALKNHVEDKGRPDDPQRMADLLASVQEAAVDPLVRKTRYAVKAFGAMAAVVGGGVSANARLRQCLTEAGEEDNFPVIFAEPVLCTDNGAMVAALGAQHLAKGRFDTLELVVAPDLSW